MAYKWLAARRMAAAKGKAKPDFRLSNVSSRLHLSPSFLVLLSFTLDILDSNSSFLGLGILELYSNLYRTIFRCSFLSPAGSLVRSDSLICPWAGCVDPQPPQDYALLRGLSPFNPYHQTSGPRTYRPPWL